MALAVKKQKIQDWLTQQWVILFGEKINFSTHNWLSGPFGDVNGIGEGFISQLAQKENLITADKQGVKGLIQSMYQLNLTDIELKNLSKQVIDFYEKTSKYELQLVVKWNPFFKLFGRLLRIMFSRRIKQLNIPFQNKVSSNNLTSDIIHLTDKITNQVKRTIWYRTYQSTGEVVYSGVYETCIIPSGKTCIKAIFPLPYGNATVILTPTVGVNGELILESSGSKVGDSGFYFVLKDSKGQLWTKYVKSFSDKLIVKEKNDKISAVQTLTLWKMRVLTFEYEIK